MLGEKPGLKNCSACLTPLFSTPAITERLAGSFVGSSFLTDMKPNDSSMRNNLGIM